MRPYEAMIIFPNSLNEEALKKAAESVEVEITRLGGVVKETRFLGSRSFVRRMQKEESGYYIVVKMEMPPDQVAAFRARMRLKSEVFRMQFVSAPKAAPAAEPAAVAAAAAVPVEGAVEKAGSDGQPQ